MAWKMPKDLSKQLSKAASDLGMFAQEMRDEFDEKSETWQESDKGNEVMAWIDELTDLADSVDMVNEEPSA